MCDELNEPIDKLKLDSESPDGQDLTTESDDTHDKDNLASEKGDEVEDEGLKLREETESKMTEEERKDLRQQAQTLKESGNRKFKEECYTDAIQDYTKALELCPLCFKKDRSIMYSNRAAAYIHTEEHDEVIKDCTQATELHPQYIKPLMRRAQTYEKTEKLDEALEDYKKILELDPRCIEALSACQRLPPMINERNEKLKTEMMGKLKDLGNLVLRPFGLSTDNFQFSQNEAGGYSVNFVNKS